MNWTHSISDDFKLLCDSRNLFQLVGTPTRPNLKFPQKSTLIDLVFTNVPHKYSSVCVFANDVSDHCVVAVARDMKLPKQNSRIITRRFMKYFNEQAFLYRKSKSDYFLDKTKVNLTNPRKLWKNMKFLNGTKTYTELPPCILTDSTKITDKKQMLNSFNSHFIASGSLFPISNDVISDLEFLEAERNLWTREFVFQQITLSDVCSVLKELNVSKSPGPDHIAPLFLKLAADFISPSLTYLFNLSLITNTIPRIWKSAFVVPLSKGGDLSLMDNYRPISKLCILSKILETLVNKQLTQYLNDYNILSSNQSGFCKGHSTTTATLKVLNDIVESLDNKQHCVCLFIDLSKAFDTVDHNILLDRLRWVGLSEHVMLWFTAYLKGRNQCVQVEGVRSDLLEVVKGVPQGSVLGPLLFSIYINCLDFNIDKARFHLYADDTIVYCSAPSKQQSVTALQSVFDIIQNRFCALKLVLNVEKTKCMLFSNFRTSLENCSSDFSGEPSYFSVRVQISGHYHR